jgi:hypothetical protein
MKKLLREYKAGRVSLEEVLAALQRLPYEDLEYARVDTHRSVRKGYPEAVFCPGKTTAQILGIVESLSRQQVNVLLTKAGPRVFNAVKKRYPTAVYHEQARMVVISQGAVKKKRGKVLVVTAGTSDIPVAEEAVVTARLMGSPVELVCDVGVAGVHRLLAVREKLQKASVIVVVAGMEGALASIIGGLTSRPVIAVPTSVGYGASFAGVAPLLTMLNSCAEGVVVVNIDNGFGAGYFASLINR